MDLGSIIVGLVIIGVCIIPFVFISANSRKRKERLLQGLFGMAEKSVKSHDTICGTIQQSALTITPIRFSSQEKSRRPKRGK